MFLGWLALSWEDGLNALVAEGIEAIVFRTVGDQASLWESVLPEELRRLPEELARVDALLDDSAFFCPFVPFFDPRMGRPSIPMETYLRLMFLKFRYRLGYESLCREVTDSITWRRFCRIPLEGSVPHPTTLMKLTTRCGEDAVAGLNEALLAKAASEKLLRTNKVRADTTVVEGDVGYPTDTGLLAKAVGSMARTVARIKAADAGSAPLGGSSGPRDRLQAAVTRRAATRSGAGLRAPDHRGASRDRRAGADRGCRGGT
ncbi:transposase [Mycobacterium tuberculosis]|uniref:Transposase n=1 Tax=Mycobacterium tuberculosis TaxID=1773 RepID=A0A0E8BBT8_MYCTX|nr:transposase [Mycobacterium tuberculosis KZN 1435]AEJ48321.1 transposase [Mycobacterium tuberculosis CCDC5079]AEJ51920.1 transposase [Mycobacterium tuberculosis CCDC5180]AGE69433.1 transposase [Mycobacterium tuberculosis variant bovis BCG str. Korea 1168P]AHJ44232.1 putative transposase [Mycobacterium tuberculosis HKBS1]AHJ48380.1 putative transposase [Mycobacterium tuberculosis BT2]AHJ52522.1 putative transposase [Mycobacterium tuberculosis BT1]AHM09177.1 putative is1560 transposase [Myco